MKIWPSRSKAKAAREQDVVTDLDAIIAEPVKFRFNGKIHTLNPIHLDEFLKFTNAQNSLSNALKAEGGLTADLLAESYFSVISSVCDDLTLNDIKSMSQAQIAALYQLVIDLVTGQVDYGDGKKKRKKLDLYDSVAPSSSQNVQPSSGGPLKKP
jgi:hypothetical protein